MDNRFENKGKDQNIAQGDGAVGKQVNVKQLTTGNNNTFTGTGDIHVHPELAPVIPRQLPPLDACFLGRDKELTDVIDQLHPGRVVTVCGPGGMGKSALAAQAVHKLEEDRFPDGIVFHSFYHQSSTDMALQTVCAAFQVEAQAGLETTVKGLLANRKALIMLDGTEEAEDLRAVLRLCSTCGVLITSRKRDDAQGFRLDLVPLEKKPAVEVLREHSGLAADDTAVQGICEILDGWPVGLRIAGRYLRNTGESTTEYLLWLEKRPFRKLGSGKHQEDNAALLLRRSMEQVSDDAVQVLRLSGVLAFASISLMPVMFVLYKDGEEQDDLELRSMEALNELVMYGLLERRGQRWQISHALVHTYARNEEALSKDALERLAGWYITFCRTQSEAGLPGYALLDGERAHCLRLMESCLDRELWQEVKDLVGAIDIYLERQGHWTEWQTALEMNLTAARKAGDRWDEAGCLNNLGRICRRCSEQKKALAYHKQSLSIRREIDDRKGEGTTLNSIGNIYREQGNYEYALEQYKQGLMIKREIGNLEGEGWTLNNIGLLYSLQGDDETALQYYEQCLPMRREVGDKIGEGVTLSNIASICYAQGEYSKTIEYYKQALKIAQKLGDRAGEVVRYWSIGRTYENMGDLAKAEEYIALAVQIAEQIGHPKLEKYREGLKQVRAARQGA